jgi:acyl-CoA synthetase (AMP-forming)/AMP-acid ligase II
MLTGNRPEALAAGWAAWRSGVYLIPLSTTLAAPELVSMLRDAGPCAVLVNAEFPYFLAEALQRGIQRYHLYRGQHNAVILDDSVKQINAGEVANYFLRQRKLIL